MSNLSPSLGLPLVQPSQAQKHVTVNEALTRLDGLVQLRLASVTTTTPPTPVDGECFAVPAGASGDWAAQTGDIAIATNGGWSFVTPVAGWRAFVVDQGSEAIFRNGLWITGAVASGASGAAAKVITTEVLHTVTAGATNTLTGFVPANSMVFAVSGRVTSTLTGSATAWDLGLPGEATKFGSGMGTGQGSYALGLLGTPTTYYSASDLLLSASGGSFTGGEIRFALHAMTLELPGL